MNPPIIVARKTKRKGPINLTDLDRKQKFSKKMSGRKKARFFDFFEPDFNEEESAPPSDLEINDDDPSPQTDEISKVGLIQLIKQIFT